MAIDAPNLDDATLVLAVQQGDTDAFAPLFDRHYARVRRACARRLGGSGEADEIAQAAFVRAFERIDRCTGPRRFGAWVQVIADRLCADSWRAQARTTPVDEPLAAELATGPDDCEEAVLRTERAAALHDALATLPSRQREVIIARDIEGRRPAEIAAALALSVGAVDSLLLRARRRMALAYRAASPDQGAASASVSTASVAAGSAAAGPLGRVVEALNGAIHSGVASVASIFGLAPPAPGVAQRVVGGVVAGALLVAPLLVADDPARHPAEGPVPGVALPAAGDPADLASQVTVPAPPAPAAPDPVAAAEPVVGRAALPAPGAPDALSAEAPQAAASPDAPLAEVWVDVPAAAVEVEADVAAVTGAVAEVERALSSRLLRTPRLP